MANSRENYLDDIQSWMAKRNADLERLRGDAHAVGQQAWAAANRAGQYIPAARPSDVAALGVQAMRRAVDQTGQTIQHVENAAVARGRSAAASASRAAATAAPEVLAGLNGAQDAFTFGLGDRAYAGIRAVDDVLHGGDIRKSYAQHYAGTQALDAYDEAHHPIARTVGQVAGTAAQIGLLGAGEGLVGGARALQQANRVRQASGLLLREASALGGAGAATGVAGQAAGDIQRGELGTIGDYVGAGLGGAAGFGTTIATRGRATLGGAVDGAVTSAVQDLLNTGSIHLDRLRQAAVVGGAAGGLGGIVGSRWANGLPNRIKGQIGEDLSRARTFVRGERVDEFAPNRIPLDEGYTVPDHQTLSGQVVEAKFGNSTKLSPRQLQAFNMPDIDYRVDSFLPRDIGAGVGSLTGTYGLARYVPDDFGSGG